MTFEVVTAALERHRARWSGPKVDDVDVAERAAVRLRETEREFLVLTREPEVRLFVRAPELDRVVWGGTGTKRKPRLHRGWHSGSIRALGDVDCVLDGLDARLAEAA